MSSILIVPVLPCDDDAVSALIPPLETIFRFPASLHVTEPIDPSFAFDVYRNQFNSTALISAFVHRFKVNSPASVNLGIEESLILVEPKPGRPWLRPFRF